jgi:hypothetical protein
MNIVLPNYNVYSNKYHNCQWSFLTISSSNAQFNLNKVNNNYYSSACEGLNNNYYSCEGL